LYLQIGPADRVSSAGTVTHPASRAKSEYDAGIGQGLACWCSLRAHRGKLSLRCLHSLVVTEVAKDIQAERRGQIALFARNVDLGDQFRQRYLLGVRDFFQVIPEGIVKAAAGLVSINDN